MIQTVAMNREEKNDDDSFIVHRKNNNMHNMYIVQNGGYK